MLAWDKVCMLKGMGELEFRDIRLFNIALLSRQVWRLLTINNTLCYDVLSSKYFPEGDIFQSKKVDKSLFTWNSIATVARTVYERKVHELLTRGSFLNKWAWGLIDFFGKRYGNLKLSQKLGCSLGSWDCPNARAVLTIGGLDGKIINNDFSSCIDWLKEAMRERVKSLSKEFRIHNVINRPILSPQFVDKKWEKLPTDKVQINFDASIINEKIGFGVLARDSEGFVMDCASLANRIRNRRVDITIMRHRINDLFKSKDMLNNVEFKWVNRNCNKSTNFMSKNAITNNCNLNFGMDYPTAMLEFVMVACQTMWSPFCELLEYMQTKIAVFPWYVRALPASWVREFPSLSSHSLPHIQSSGETYPDC
ncbi:hypothetical protein Golob_002430, partial [Gossypium lobatum]|nr:hypothetical protein [Gossypium lobatum]